ncbi:phage tail tape measure protein [Streptomyces sp. NPDC059373]
MGKAVVYDLIARDRASRTMDHVGRKAGVLDRTLRGVGKAALYAGAAVGGALVVGLAESAKQAVDFQSKMLKIQTQAGATAKDVKVLSKAVLELGTKTQQGPQHLADSLYHLKSVGMDNADAMKALKQASDLAAVGGADLEATTNALAGAWRTGIKGATSFSEAAATVNAIIGAGNMRMEDFTAAIGTGILPTAKTFGLSMKSVGAALATLTDEGVPAVDAATRLRMSISLLAAPSGKAEKQLAKIGLSGTTLAKAMRGPSGLIGAIQLIKDHLDKSGMSAVAASQLLSRAFGGGRSSSTILALVNNLDVLKKKQDQINGSIGKFPKAVEEQRKTAQAQWKLLVSNLEVLSIKIGMKVLPPLTHFVSYLDKTALPAVIHFGQGLLKDLVPQGTQSAMATLQGELKDLLTGLAGIGKILVDTVKPLAPVAMAGVKLFVASIKWLGTTTAGKSVAQLVLIGAAMRKILITAQALAAISWTSALGRGLGSLVGTSAAGAGVAAGATGAGGAAAGGAATGGGVLAAAGISSAALVTGGALALIGAVGLYGHNVKKASDDSAGLIEKGSGLVTAASSAGGAHFSAAYRKFANSFQDPATLKTLRLAAGDSLAAHTEYINAVNDGRTKVAGALYLGRTAFGQSAAQFSNKFGQDVGSMGANLKKQGTDLNTAFNRSMSKVFAGMDTSQQRHWSEFLAEHKSQSHAVTKKQIQVTGRDWNTLTAAYGKYTDDAFHGRKSKEKADIAAVARATKQWQDDSTHGLIDNSHANTKSLQRHIAKFYADQTAGNQKDIAADVKWLTKHVKGSFAKFSKDLSSSASFAFQQQMTAAEKKIAGLHLTSFNSKTGTFVRARGGIVYGPGGPRDDAIPTWLSNGEYVVNARSTKMFRGLLEHLNARGLKNGGIAGASGAWGKADAGAAYFGAARFEQALYNQLHKLQSGINTAATSGLAGGSLGVHGTGSTAIMNLGRQMMQAKGWGADQWAALRALWQGESGWNPKAKNASSGAYGIPQALPAKKMASAGSDWQTNPATQIKWGLSYIKSRYGSPGAAYNAWLGRSPHWYAKGTSGAARGLAWVGERGPELVNFKGGEDVLSHPQSMAFAKSNGIKLPGYASGTILNAADRVRRDKRAVSDARDAVSRAKRRHKGEAAADKRLKAAEKELKAAEIALANAKRSAKTSIANTIANGLQKTLATGSSSAIASALKSLNTKLLNAGFDKLAKSVMKTGDKLEKLADKKAGVSAQIAAAKSYASDQKTNLLDYLSISGTTAGSVTDLISQMKGSQKTAGDFSKLATSLRDRGASKDLLEQLAAAGPGSQLATILGDPGVTAQQITQLNALFTSQNKLATSFGNNMADVMYDSGKHAGEGFLAGLKAQEKDLQKQMDKLAAGMVKAIKKSLKINSPSVVMRDEVGWQVGAGVVAGMDAHAPHIAAAASRMAATAAGVSIPRIVVPKVTNRARAGSSSALTARHTEAMEQLAAALANNGGSEVHVHFNDAALKDLIDVQVKPKIKASEDRTAFRQKVGRR